ncbi:hypothetical protein [Anaerovibrio lipolyticus]|uniref:hypothetical protein n=1 Tax=Anaerovibrio lipolyticus TaxID=82374 RepID=UPI0026F10498|nr:hypothetical protein [Anaerovibrio lipolyticus]MBE6106935.1 hypothetical protein [Anaerovibrio lipolyticus]
MIVDGKTEYELITQSELVERLHQEGMKITSQTLRNWEKNELIVPPVRKDNHVSGRSAFYYDYVLAECYAVYNLSRGLDFSPNFPSMPKFSMDNIKIGRNGFLFHHFGLLSGYPEAPTNVLPLKQVSDPDRRKEVFELIDKCGKDVYEKQLMGLEKAVMLFLTQGWMIALEEGCDKFLKKYKR